jgi:ubiquinone/menaquinone biosynthesis C-methylase UbiE
MKEVSPESKTIVAGFEFFLRQHLEIIDDPQARMLWKRRKLEENLEELTAVIELDRKYPISDAESYTDDQMQEIFEVLGPEYGIHTDTDDQRMILSHLLDFGVRDVRTLSIGCGVAPHEIFLSSQGLVTKEIVGVDFVQSVLERGQLIATEVGVGNLRFAKAKGSEINYHDEFGQVWIIDSLHWMAGWRECLRRAALALKTGGNLFICNSRHSPRVKIDEKDVAAILLQQGLEIADIIIQESHADSQRAIITAKKEAIQASKLFIPKNSGL